MNEYNPSESRYNPSPAKRTKTVTDYKGDATAGNNSYKGPITLKLECIETNFNEKMEQIVGLLEENLNKVRKAKEEIRQQKEEIKSLKEEMNLQRQEAISLRSLIHNWEQKRREENITENPIIHRTQVSTNSEHSNAQVAQLTRTMQHLSHTSWLTRPPPSYGINPAVNNLSEHCDDFNVRMTNRRSNSIQKHRFRK